MGFKRWLLSAFLVPVLVLMVPSSGWARSSVGVAARSPKTSSGGGGVFLLVCVGLMVVGLWWVGRVRARRRDLRQPASSSLRPEVQAAMDTLHRSESAVRPAFSHLDARLDSSEILYQVVVGRPFGIRDSADLIALSDRRIIAVSVWSTSGRGARDSGNFDIQLTSIQKVLWRAGGRWSSVLIFQHHVSVPIEIEVPKNEAETFVEHLQALIKR